MKNNTSIKQKLIARDGLKCSVTGADVSSPDELDVNYVKPIENGGTNELDNLVLVKRDVNFDIVADERRHARQLLRELRQRQDELAKREIESFEREKTYRQRLEDQQRELEEYRARLRMEQTEREKRLHVELELQGKLLDEQHRNLQNKLRENEEVFGLKLRELEDERRALTQALREREELLQLSFQELEQEKHKYTEESRKKIEHNSAAYVNDALIALDQSAKSYHRISRNWSLTGLASLVLGVAAAGYFGLVGLGPAVTSNETDWARTVYFGFKGIILVALFVAIAKYCFSYSQSFMHESLKNSERKHAINFGKFYLQSYGANAEWKQVREAFEHWNIASTSAFSKPDADKFDPKIVEHASQLIEAVGKLRLSLDDNKVAEKKDKS